LRHWNTPTVCLLYVALLVAAAMGVDRLVATRLFAHPYEYVPGYRAFPEYAVGVKLHQFESANRRFDGLFIGNSRTMFGVDPRAFDAELARHGVRFSSYNLALPSFDVRFWPEFFRRYYRAPAPGHLFIGILPRDLDAHYAYGETLIRQFFASAGFEQHRRGALARWADEQMARLFLMRGHGADKKLIGLGDVLAGRRLDLNAIQLANDQGWSKLPRGVQLRTGTLRVQARRLAERRGKTRFELGAAHVRSLTELDRWIRSRGGTLTLFTTPLLYDREDPWGTIEMRRGFDRAVRRLVRRLPNVRFVDLGRRAGATYSLADYADGDHLNPAGAHRFSRDLADAVAPALTVRRLADPALVSR
jgi:lysophospholipase L1-like esterase